MLESVCHEHQQHVPWTNAVGKGWWGHLSHKSHGVTRQAERAFTHQLRGRERAMAEGISLWYLNAKLPQITSHPPTLSEPRSSASHCEPHHRWTSPVPVRTGLFLRSGIWLSTNFWVCNMKIWMGIPCGICNLMKSGAAFVTLHWAAQFWITTCDETFHWREPVTQRGADNREDVYHKHEEVAWIWMNVKCYFLHCLEMQVDRRTMNLSLWILNFFLCRTCVYAQVRQHYLSTCLF